MKRLSNTARICFVLRGRSNYPCYCVRTLTCRGMCDRVIFLGTRRGLFEPECLRHKVIERKLTCPTQTYAYIVQLRQQQN